MARLFGILCVDRLGSSHRSGHAKLSIDAAAVLKLAMIKVRRGISCPGDQAHETTSHDPIHELIYMYMYMSSATMTASNEMKALRAPQQESSELNVVQLNVVACRVH